MKLIKVTVTGAGSHVLVFCSKCGPVDVVEGSHHPYDIGRDHLRTHGCPDMTMNFEAQNEEG